MSDDGPEPGAGQLRVADLILRAALQGCGERHPIGGPMAHAFNLVEQYHHTAYEIAQILRGTSPGDISYWQLTKCVPTMRRRAAVDLDPTMARRDPGRGGRQGKVPA